MTEEMDNNVVRSAEYALGVMDPTEVSAFEDDLSKDPVLRQMYADWAEGFVAFDDDGVAPDSSVKARLDQTLFGKPKAAQQHWFLRWGLRSLTVGVGLAVMINYLTGPFYDLQAVGSSDTIAFDVRIDVDKRVVLTSSLTETLTAEKDHELWIIPKDGTPISLGVMAERKTVDIPGDFDFDGALIAVTIEQAGGSPTGQPTTAPIVALPLTTL